VNHSATAVIAKKATVLPDFVTYYEAHKTGFAHWVGVNDWLLHTHIGMAIFVSVIIIFRRTLTSPWPLIVVSIAELANEYLDRLAYGSWRVPDTLRDVAFTLSWPLLFFLLAKIGAIRVKS
jgi:hypothetical protein